MPQQHVQGNTNNFQDISNLNNIVKNNFLASQINAFHFVSNYKLMLDNKGLLVRQNWILTFHKGVQWLQNVLQVFSACVIAKAIQYKQI